MYLEMKSSISKQHMSRKPHKCIQKYLVLIKQIYNVFINFNLFLLSFNILIVFSNALSMEKLIFSIKVDLKKSFVLSH